MREWIEMNIGISGDLAYRFIATVVAFVLIIVARWVIARWMSRRLTDPDLIFRARKAATYIATITFVLIVTWVWLPFFDDLGTFLGLLSAGLAIALADVFLDLAGWLFIMFRRPFKVGDRVEIHDVAGDVIDIRAFRFTVLEIRNWVEADQATGRVIHIPNGYLFKYSTANFTEGFFHVWHEIPVLVTFESDWNRAEELIRSALTAVEIDREVLERQQQIASSTRDYFINFRELRSTVYVSTTPSGILLTGRLLVEARKRRSVEDAVWRSLLETFADEPSVDLAYPTERTVITDPLRIEEPPTTPGV